MNLSVKTQKMLWGRAAARCSYPSCRMEVFSDEREASTLTLIGENCHIVVSKMIVDRDQKSIRTTRSNKFI